MEKPQPPEDWECCESECSPCVWDTYYEELRLWRAQNTETTSESAAAEGDEDE
ncbi:hypothetical protein FJM67_12990 [Maribrevibacterium harenarium]|uniref:Oxidoreductase-like domain-containing protein n=1 Tax=Maribrevibacterium harenarium TaxID=2589817 RepID=A0A501WN73_9GAMM|nr:oxidoreductase-like domain-containing protein [Maribrevibacterium harenarium]TPE48747.1 hypothetical protein FJM67_12990 [Maribrevibacterium harenarium]